MRLSVRAPAHAARRRATAGSRSPGRPRAASRPRSPWTPARSSRWPASPATCLPPAPSPCACAPASTAPPGARGWRRRSRWPARAARATAYTDPLWTGAARYVQVAAASGSSRGPASLTGVRLVAIDPTEDGSVAARVTGVVRRLAATVAGVSVVPPASAASSAPVDRHPLRVGRGREPALRPRRPTRRSRSRSSITRPAATSTRAPTRRRSCAASTPTTRRAFTGTTSPTTSSSTASAPSTRAGTAASRAASSAPTSTASTPAAPASRSSARSPTRRRPPRR